MTALTALPTLLGIALAPVWLVLNDGLKANRLDPDTPPSPSPRAVAGLAATMGALLVVPLGSCPALLRFPGDFVLLVGLLAIARFSTGRPGLAELALLVDLAAVARGVGETSLSGMHLATSVFRPERVLTPILGLVAASLGLIAASRGQGRGNRVERHAGAIMIWVLGALIVGVALPPRTGWVPIDLALALAAMLGLAVALARVGPRLERSPRTLVAATAIAALALLIAWVT